MKKLLSSVILVILLTCPFYSQAQRPNSSWIAADIGMNSDWILYQNTFGNPRMAYTPKFNFSGGASFKRIYDTYGFSAGLGIAYMGQNYSDKMAGASAQRSLNLAYVQVPLMGMYYLSGFKQSKWVSFGAEFMYLLSAQQDFNRSEGGSPLPNPETLPLGTTDVTTRFNPFDVMLACEISNVFSVSFSDKLKTTVSLKGALGLTDINDKASHIPYNKVAYSGSHNFYVGIHVGMMYNVDKKTKYRMIKPFTR